MRHLLNTLGRDLEKFGFQQISEYTVDSIIEYGLNDKIIASNGLDTSTSKMALSIKGISDQELAVEISYSNQLMTEDKMTYLKAVMDLINTYNEKIKRNL